MRVEMTRKHFVLFFSPGSFVSNESEVEIPARDPAVVTPPDSAFAFCFFDRLVGAAEGDAVQIPVASRDIDKSPRYYIGGELFTVEQVEALLGRDSILAGNMRSNGWDHVVRARTGNWQPLAPGDVLLPASAKKPS